MPFEFSDEKRTVIRLKQGDVQAVETTCPRVHPLDSALARDGHGLSPRSPRSGSGHERPGRTDLGSGPAADQPTG